MDIFEIIALLLTLTAIFSYANYRLIKLPVTIGVMLIALVFSLVLVALEQFGINLGDRAEDIMKGIDFNQTLMQGMLSFLLFAGALHVDLGDLAKQKIVILVLATVGVLISTFISGTLFYFAAQGFGYEISYAYGLLFGALISPTDPIAVLGILKKISVPKELETKIAGESLFNDGVGVVVFIVISEIAIGGAPVEFGHISLLFLEEAVGGILFGVVIGLIAYYMLKSIDNYKVEVLITLGLVAGGYALASAIHTSGPIAIVVAGLFIGNKGRQFAMSEKTREHLDNFWELTDEILNAILFLLIGLEVLILRFTQSSLIMSLFAIVFVLFARMIAVGVPITALKIFKNFPRGTSRILLWGGLKGGISVALALSIPPGPERSLILVATYVVVVFSIVVQGLTIKPLALSIFKNRG
jgi:CPA1 family monovalent cation:H+ antiporter